jgi:RNA polymerase sigma factor (sigma-70 family)
VRLRVDEEDVALDESDLQAFISNDYARVVNAVALGALGFADAEDAVQEALVRAWIHTGKGQPIDRLDAWVTVAAWNHSRSGLRRVGAERRARERLAAMARGADDEATDDALDIARALALLPRRQRQVAILRYLLRLSTGETAAVLGVSEGTVKRSLSDARVSLSAALGIHDEEEEEATDVADR